MTRFPIAFARLCAACALVVITPGRPAAAQGTPGLPRALVRELKSAAGLPVGQYELVRVWSAAGPLAGHRGGHAVADAAADHGRAWEASPGRDVVADELLYGPYLDVPEGDYVAFYRLRLGEEAGDEPVALLDAAVDNGQNVLNSADLRGSDLSPGRWVEVPLAFHCAGKRLECRLRWSAYFPLRIDTISLFRLIGGHIEPPRRAPEAAFSDYPKNLAFHPQAAPGEIFPRSVPPAAHLVVSDVTRQPPDMQLLLFSLQGLVNRSRPRLYLLYNPTDRKWLGWMLHRGWIRSIEEAPAETLVRRFHTAFHGAVVTDPDLPASKNVATMLAGVRTALVASPRMAARLRLPVVADLRGRWKTSVAAYAWAFDHLWPQLTHKVIACSYPDHLALRDYLVANRVFIFWLSGPIDGAKPYADPTAEARLMERLFARMPANIPVMSYPWAGAGVGIGEGPGVTLFAQFAKYLVGSVDLSNLTVHSGIRPARLAQQPAPAPPALQRDRAYVAVVISDGDNLPVLATGNYPQLWAQPQRGHIPLGWTVSPSASMLIPDIVDYYYRTETADDMFLGAVSGIGYTYPDSYATRYRPEDRARVWDGFLDQTRSYMAKEDLTDLWVMGVSADRLLASYALRIPQLDGLFPDYGRRVAGYADATYPTARLVPVFHAVTNWSDGMQREAQIASVVAQVRQITPQQRPCFLQLFVLNWFSDLGMLREIERRLGPDYAFVRPDQLVKLYSEELAHDRLLIRAPGEVAALAGRQSSFDATVQNVTRTPIAVRMDVASGLTGAVVRPARVELPGGGSARVSVSGEPDGDEAALRARGTFGERTSRVRLLRLASDELLDKLPDGALRFVREWDAVSLPHRSGASLVDAAAGGRTVWSAEPGSAEPGWIVYGPYSELPAGHYVALFRVKRTGAGSGELATLDASTDGGKHALGQRSVTVDELPEDTYRLAAVPFDHPGGAIETRVSWTGAAGIAVDTITVWRVR